MLLTNISQEVINDFFTNIDYSKSLSQYAENFTYSNVENFMLKLIGLVIVFSMAKIILFYTLQKGKVSLKPDKKEKTKSVNEMSYWEFKAYQKQLERQGVFEKEEPIDMTVNTPKTAVEPVEESRIIVQDEITRDLVDQARSLFNTMLKNHQLNRADILAIKEFLKNETKKTNKKYKNEAHFIYSKLKEVDIKAETVEEMIKFLQTRIPKSDKVYYKILDEYGDVVADEQFCLMDKLEGVKEVCRSNGYRIEIL